MIPSRRIRISTRIFSAYRFRDAARPWTRFMRGWTLTHSDTRARPWTPCRRRSDHADGRIIGFTIPPA